MKCRNLLKVLAALALCLLAGLFVSPLKAEAATKAKVVLEFTDGTKMTWKTGDSKLKIGKKKLAYVYFGEYPQTEVTGKKLTKAIKNAKYDENGIATVKGVKYKRIEKEDTTHVYDSSVEGDKGKDLYYDWAGRTYAYFKLEPIKWRVLSEKNGTVFLLSEYGLDDQKYNKEYSFLTWEECTLRSWINGAFLKSAFNAKERKLIKTTTLENADNAFYGTKGGKNTKDKVYLLSLDDIMNTKYGFDSDRDAYDINRRCSATDFAKAMGAYTFYQKGDYNKTKEENWAGSWWLRSPGAFPSTAALIFGGGFVFDLGDLSVDFALGAVRPALHLNLSSAIG